MSRSANSPEQPATVARLADRHDDARRFAAEQDRGRTWKTLPGASSIGFMELRGCMCRWPVSDPQHPGVVRYCGSVCPAEASYCASHREMAFAPNRSRVAPPNRPAAALPPSAA